MRTVYIADDGTEFDDEDDCFAYEQERNLDNGKHTFFDNGLKRIKEFKDCEDVYYVYIENEKDVEETRDFLSNYVGVYSDNISHEGLWMYDTLVDNFVDIDDKMARLENELIELQHKKTTILKQIGGKK